MNLEIHKVLPEDAYEYIACHIACWQSAYKGIMPANYLENIMPQELEERVEKLKKALELSERSYHYATIDNKMIGRLVIGKSCDEDKPGAGEVYSIYLLKGFWGKGYGRQLMDYVTNELKGIGYREIIVWALEKNIRARRFYENYGFAIDGATREGKVVKSLINVRHTLNV